MSGGDQVQVLETLGIRPAQIIVQILGFLILFLALAKFMWKPLLGLMAAREKEVADALGQADDLKRKNEELDAEYRARMSKIDEEAQKRLAEELHRAHEMGNRLVQDYRKQAEFEKEKAMNAIKEESRKARIDLRDYAVNLSMDIADKVLREKIDRASHENLVRKFLSELDPLN
jgi:F-type H+-transporting ATPase subunit b